MLPAILALLGSMGGGALASHLGAGALAKAGLMGLGSAIGTKVGGGSAEDALLAGLLTGGLGALVQPSGALASGQAAPAAGAAQAAGATATGEGVGAVFDAMGGGAGAAAGAANPAAGAAQTPGGLSKLLEVVKKNPGLALAGAGGLLSLLPNPGAIPVSLGDDDKGLPEAFPPHQGPLRGYGHPMSAEQYKSYGRVGGAQPREFAFFDGPTTPAPAPAVGGGLGAGGGLVAGGRPGRDTVDARGPTGAPIKLNNGEFVLNAGAVSMLDPAQLELLNRMGLRALG